MYYQANAVDVALRKESVDRNMGSVLMVTLPAVALRKESVDRNKKTAIIKRNPYVALRKESVDRNIAITFTIHSPRESLSARRAWIEIPLPWP